jgi:hypothetical protein
VIRKAQDAVESAMGDADKLFRTLKRGSSQVKSVDEKSSAKATGITWFRSHRPLIERTVDRDLLQEVDGYFKELIDLTDHASNRTRYLSLLKSIKAELSEIRGHALAPKTPPDSTADTTPDFGYLVSDLSMKTILAERWMECTKCLRAEAPLAATVMMGGLMEGLLLARINWESNKAPIFSAKRAPKNNKTGKTLPLSEWTLRHYIDVAHELKWISSSAKDVGAVLRDYRNYVHPHKELSHGIVLDTNDAKMFWEITKTIARQLLQTV